jgi:hypothetical protein
VPAAFGAYLVFDVDGRDASSSHRSDRPRNVKCAAPPGIDVRQQRNRGCLDDAARVGQNVVHRADAKIGQAQRICGDAPSGKVQGAKPGGLCHARRKRRDSPDNLKWFFCCQRVSKPAPRRWICECHGITISQADWKDEQTYTRQVCTAYGFRRDHKDLTDSL